MRRRPSGFLLVEIIVALSIFCGVLAILLLGLEQSAETTALTMEHTKAACRLEEGLAQLRLAAREARREKTTGLAEGVSTITSFDGSTGLEREKYTIVAEPWAEDERLAKVTITLTWRSRGNRTRSMRVVTLLRTILTKWEPAP